MCLSYNPLHYAQIWYGRLFCCISKIRCIPRVVAVGVVGVRVVGRTASNACSLGITSICLDSEWGHYSNEEHYGANNNRHVETDTATGLIFLWFSCGPQCSDGQLEGGYPGHAKSQTWWRTACTWWRMRFAEWNRKLVTSYFYWTVKNMEMCSWSTMTDIDIHLREDSVEGGAISLINSTLHNITIIYHNGWWVYSQHGEPDGRAPTVPRPIVTV